MPAYDGPIVDAHHHLWRYSAGAYPWLEGASAALRRDVTPANYWAALASHDIAATVWVEAVAADPVAEAMQAQAWADAEPGLCAAIVAHCPLDADDVETRLDRLLALLPRLRGIRDIVSWRPHGPSFARRQDLLVDPGFERGLRALAARRLSFDLMALPHQLADAARLVARLPELSVIVEHAGSPDERTAEGIGTWRRGLRALAALPNTAVKISALHCLDPGWTQAWIGATIDEVVGMFGAGRACFGTDFPVHDLARPAAAAMDDFKAATAGLSPGEQRALFHDTASRLYRLSAEGP